MMSFWPQWRQHVRRQFLAAMIAVIRTVLVLGGIEMVVVLVFICDNRDNRAVTTRGIVGWLLQTLITVVILYITYLRVVPRMYY